MRIEYDFKSLVSASDEVPLEVRQTIVENLAASEQAELKAFRDRNSKVELIRKEGKEKVIQLMGAAKHAEWVAFARKQRQVTADAIVKAGPLITEEQGKTIDEQRVARTRKFLTRLGVSADKVKEITRSMVERFEKLLPPPPTREGKPVVVMHPDAVPHEIRNGTANPWQVFRAPFSGVHWNPRIWLGGFSKGLYTPEVWAESASGNVGNINVLFDRDADDYDVGDYEFDTAVGFWYRMPAAGLLDVWIEGQVGDGSHYVGLRDEFGFSDSSVNQRCYITLQATGPTQSSKVSLAAVSQLAKSGYTDGSWHRNLSAGAIYWGHLYSDLSFPAGAWVYIKAGIRTANSCFANDVAVTSSTFFKWFIRSVWVESTGLN